MYSILLRNNLTKEERLYGMNLEWGDHSVFWLTEGNFGCDCNREDCFSRANNEEDVEDSKCGTTRFAIPYVILEDGTKISIDGE